MKQIAGYKKEIQKLKAKLESALPTRVEALENELKTKDETIEGLKVKVRTLEKMEKVYHTSDISKIEKELNSRVSMLTQELAFHRKKAGELHKQGDKEKPIAHVRAASLVQHKEPRPEKAMPPPPHPDPDLEKLKQSIEVLEYSKVSLGKKYKTEMESLQARNARLEEEVQALRNQLSNKEKETNIVLSKFNEMKRRATMYTLEPIKRNSIADPQMPSVLTSEKRREFKGVVATINKEFNGVLKRFDDTDALTVGSAYRIAKVSFRWKDDRILAMSAEYQADSGAVTLKESFGKPTEDNYSRIDLELTGGEYINSLEGYHDSKHIGTKHPIFRVPENRHIPQTDHPCRL